MRLTDKSRCSFREACLSVTFPTKNPTWTSLGFDLDLDKDDEDKDKVHAPWHSPEIILGYDLIQSTQVKNGHNTRDINLNQPMKVVCIYICSWDCLFSILTWLWTG